MKETGVPPLLVQYKLWLLWNDIAAELAEADGVRILRPPAQAADAQGLLRPEFTHDVVHGNARYGALVLDQVHALLQAGA